MSLQNSKQISDVKVLLKMGSDGSGIASIEKTGTSGLVDTYTITYDNGNKTTFTVTNGNGIDSIAKTGTSGLIDTYTITFQDGTTTTFEVTNGRGISSIEKTATQGLVDTYTITYNDNTTSTFTVTNGEGSTASTLPYNNATSGLSATNVQDAIDEVDGNVDTLQDTKADQTVIATRQANLVAVKKYEIGEQFIYNNMLYKADAVISQNGTITIGGNASLADNIVSQISNLANQSYKLNTTGFTSWTDNNWHEIPCDGYVTITFDNAQGRYAWLQIENTNRDVLNVSSPPNSGLYSTPVLALFVRKGLKVRLGGTADHRTAYFYPLMPI